MSSLDFDVKRQCSLVEFRCQRMKVYHESDCSSLRRSREVKAVLPTLQSPNYYIEPCLEELARKELRDPGYSSHVLDFTVGRSGYGSVRFLGETDVRWLQLDQIVKFSRHEIVVYEDEAAKPEVGEGLNKTAEVTLILNIKMSGLKGDHLDSFVKKLRYRTERQGAKFISFNSATGEWKFLVDHFSRFGLSDDEADDIIMDDAPAVNDPVDMNEGETYDGDNGMHMDAIIVPELAHSLPAHLGLDPAKMKEMRMLMFTDEEEADIVDVTSRQKTTSRKEYIRSPRQNSIQRLSHRSTPPIGRKNPVPLLEYNPGNQDTSSTGTILLAQQNKGMPLKAVKAEGFKLDLERETPMSRNHSHNIVDTALFMGRSFRVGWGPNGVLVHTGTPVCNGESHGVLSSVILLEKIAIDKVVRDENNKVKKELVDSAFDAPLDLHRAINHETKDIQVGSFKLKLQKLICDRLMLPDICSSYIDITERQLEVSGLSSSARLVLIHQIMVWELIKVLFSDRENGGQPKSVAGDNDEDMMQDLKEGSLEFDQEALPLIRRAGFSFWLQESVSHRVQDEISSLNEVQYLEQIFILLTGRQLDAAVEMTASRGDVRLACLLSQAGGSMANRSDVARQLDLWRTDGLDFRFIEKERLKIFELLAGNIHGSLNDVKIDWKRFLGLLMWYHLPPNTSLSTIFLTYKQLLEDGRAPYPDPIYIDEGPADDSVNWTTEKHCDLSYYLMILHASENNHVGFLKPMFSAFSSTNDPLDYHMIWHQRAILESIGVFSASDLHVIDMSFVSQLLSLGKCHWAIYVVLHMPYRGDFPYLQANVIREILFQYCESWSLDDSQWEFIESLGVPSEWLHEAMAVYFNYYGDLPKALEHFLKCKSWQKAHSIFVTSVAHKLFLSAKHAEIWRLATSMDDYKSEIENWDLGAGIYISFYLIRSSLQEDDNSMSGLDSLESKDAACRDFLGRLNESLAVWGAKLPVDARVAYSKMAEEVSSLLLSDVSDDSTPEAQLNCFDTVFTAPVPEDVRSSQLQDAVSLFTCYLSSEVAS